MTKKELMEENERLHGECGTLRKAGETLCEELDVLRKHRDEMQQLCRQQEERLKQMQPQLLSLIQAREDTTHALVKLINHGVQAAGAAMQKANA